MDQPYSRIVDAILDHQFWSPNDPQKHPYDDTGWTFQYMRNLVIKPLDDKTALAQKMTPVTADVRAPGGIEGADRRTRVGRFLRATSLDELPQLMNVLSGDMSLVGPRPLVEEEDALLQGFDRHRTRLTPGITGPWQLRGPMTTSIHDLAKLDYVYAANWSIWGDIDVLVGTLTRMIRGAGH